MDGWKIQTDLATHRTRRTCVKSCGDVGDPLKGAEAMSEGQTGRVTAQNPLGEGMNGRKEGVDIFKLSPREMKSPWCSFSITLAWIFSVLMVLKDRR